MMVHGEDQVEITVHYVREDRNYEDWNLWLWEEGGQGAQVDFTGEDDYGKVATLFTTSAKTRFGFLVRKGNWAEKDIDTDRFFQIEAGGMDGVDACFGMHGMPSLSTGQMDITPGYRMAGCDTIYVKLEGVSGHSSMPHLARDTIHPACVFVTGLQGIITKNLNAQDPVVLSVGKFMGGTKANIISKYTELEISMRYFSPEARKRVHEGIRRHAKAIGEAYEVKVDVEIEESALSLYNEEEVTRIASESAEKVFGKQNIITTPRLMGSEDMPFYFQHAKGVYAFLGYRNEEKEAVYFPHHEKFKIDEDYLKFGVALHVQFALDFLRSS